MAKLKIISLVLMFTQFAQFTHAHPVAYQGAWGIMAFMQPGMQDWQIAHSVTSRVALAVEGVKDSMNAESKYYLMPKINVLLKRWNMKNAQANLYTTVGLGLINVGNYREGAATYGAEADYETREFYISGKFNEARSKNYDPTTLIQFRVGFAPYVADYEAFHTWVILSQQYFPNSKGSKYEIGPVLRFYYKNVLWETGATQNGNWIFNFMIHL